MTLLILFFLLSIGFSFLCSILEAVLLSITPSYISAQVNENPELGKRIKSLKEDVDKPLSAILTLNTIAHTVGAIGVGIQASKVFGNTPLNLGFFSIGMESVIAIIMTIAILILSEIIPKTLGANYWKSMTPFTVSSLSIMNKLLFPFVWVSQMITKKLKKDKGSSVLSRAEFKALTQASAESGALEITESQVIYNLLKLGTIPVKEIMTPRSVMHWARAEETLFDYYKSHDGLKYSRIPVFKTDREEVTGILLKDELLESLLNGKQEEKVEGHITPAIYVNADTSVDTLQKELMNSRSHIAVVSDEFGTVVGIVTMEDVIETILGFEIVDETDGQADLQKLAKELWQKRAKQKGIIE